MLQSVKGERRRRRGAGGNWGLRGQQVMGLKCETPLRREEGGLGSLLGIKH